MEHNYLFWGIVGIISGLIAALADVPLVKPGRPDPDTAVLKGKIQTWWAEVPSKRFVVSFWMSFLGQPGTYIVMWLLAGLISKNNDPLGIALRINTFIGCFTGLLCHVAFCIKPLIYQRLHKKLNDGVCIEIIDSVDPLFKVPMLIGFLTLWLGGTIIVSIAIITGALSVSKWCLLLNPVVSIILLMTLKKMKVKIIGPLGVGYMLFAILLIIAGVG